MNTRLARRLRQSAQDDRGFSLVEVTVSMVIVMVVFAALLAALLTGVASARTEQDRATANQLAADTVENLRVIEWNKLGFYASDFTTFPALQDGESVVKLPGTFTAPTREQDEAPRPTRQDVLVNGVNHTVTTWVTWAGSSATTPNTGTTYGAKRVTVTVTYQTKTGTKSVTTAGLRSPTAKEMAPPATTTTAAPVTVANASVTASQTLTSTYALSSPLDVSIETPSTADYVTLTWVQDGVDKELELVPDATKKFWSKPTGSLLAGTGPFPSGTFTFDFTAGRYNGETQAATSSVVFTAPAGGSSFVISSSSVVSAVDPAAHVLDASYRTTSVLTISATTSTNVDSVVATYKYSSNVQQQLSLVSTNGGTTWTATIPVGTGPFFGGANTVQLSAKKGSSTVAAAPAVVLTPSELGSISISQPFATPGLCEGKNNNQAQLLQTSALQADVKNVGASDTVQFALMSGSPASAHFTSQAGTGVSAGANGFTFSVSLPSGTKIAATGDQAVRVTVTRAADGASQISSFTVPVSHPSNGKC